MERTITAFHSDQADDWVAELSCGHNQHVRHHPPFHDRPWVVDPMGQESRIGTPIQCALCARTEIPDDLRLVRSSPEWDERTVPAGLLRSHCLAERTWGRITVAHGRLRFSAATEPCYERVLGRGDDQGVPPGIEHWVEPVGSVRFSIDFLAVDREIPDVASPLAQTLPTQIQTDLEEGGDPACWLSRVCQECGAVLEGAPHRHDRS
jgi:tellurite methyltransferase